MNICINSFFSFLQRQGITCKLLDSNTIIIESSLLEKFYFIPQSAHMVYLIEDLTLRQSQNTKAYIDSFSQDFIFHRPNFFRSKFTQTDPDCSALLIDFYRILESFKRTRQGLRSDETKAICQPNRQFISISKQDFEKITKMKAQQNYREMFLVIEKRAPSKYRVECFYKADAQKAVKICSSEHRDLTEIYQVAFYEHLCDEVYKSVINIRQDSLIQKRSTY